MRPRVAGSPPAPAVPQLLLALQVLTTEERFTAAARRAKCSKRCLAKL